MFQEVKEFGPQMAGRHSLYVRLHDKLPNNKHNQHYRALVRVIFGVKVEVLLNKI